MMNNKPLLVLSEHFALAASMSIVLAVATLLIGFLRALWGDPCLIYMDGISFGMTLLDVSVMALLQSLGKNGTRPLVMSPLVTMAAPVSYTHLTLPTNREV